jgi:hypothetical protein
MQRVVTARPQDCRGCFGRPRTWMTLGLLRQPMSAKTSSLSLYGKRWRIAFLYGCFRFRQVDRLAYRGKLGRPHDGHDVSPPKPPLPVLSATCQLPSPARRSGPPTTLLTSQSVRCLLDCLSSADPRTSALIVCAWLEAYQGLGCTYHRKALIGPAVPSVVAACVMDREPGPRLELAFRSLGSSKDRVIFCQGRAEWHPTHWLQAWPRSAEF